MVLPKLKIYFKWYILQSQANSLGIVKEIHHRYLIIFNVYYQNNMVLKNKIKKNQNILYEPDTWEIQNAIHLEYLPTISEPSRLKPIKGQW